MNNGLIVSEPIGICHLREKNRNYKNIVGTKSRYFQTSKCEFNDQVYEKNKFQNQLKIERLGCKYFLVFFNQPTFLLYFIYITEFTIQNVSNSLRKALSILTFTQNRIRK